MKNILSFLDKFKNLIRSKTFIEECVVSVFKDLSLPLSIKDFEIRDKTLVITSHSAPLRSEIRLRKDNILKKIEEKVGSRSILNIQ